MPATGWTLEDKGFLRLFLKRWENLCADHNVSALTRALASWQASTKAKRKEERELRLLALRARIREHLAGTGTAPAGRSPEQLADLVEWARGLSAFRGLGGDALEQVCSALRLRELLPREVVFFQGQMGEDYTVIFEGSVDLFNTNDRAQEQRQRSSYLADGAAFSAHLRTLSNEAGRDGDGVALSHLLGARIHTVPTSAGFGELALFSLTGTRSCTAAVAHPHGAILAVLPRATYSEALLALHQKKMAIATKIAFLNRLPMFQQWRAGQLAQLAYSLEEVTYTKGMHVMREHHDARFMLFIAEGEAHVTKALQPRVRSLRGGGGRGSGLPAGSGASAVAASATATTVAAATATATTSSASHQSALEMLPSSRSAAERNSAALVTSSGLSHSPARRPSFSAPKQETQLAVTATIGANDFVGAEALLGDSDEGEGGAAVVGVFQYGVVAAKTLRTFKLAAPSFRVLLKGARGSDTMESIASIVRARRELRNATMNNAATSAASSSSALGRRSSRCSLGGLAALPEGASLADGVLAQETDGAQSTGSGAPVLARRDSMSKEGSRKRSFQVVPLAEADSTPMEQAHVAASIAAAEQDRRLRAMEQRQEKVTDPFAGCNANDAGPAPTSALDAGESAAGALPIAKPSTIAMANLSRVHSQRLGAPLQTSSSLSMASGFASSGKRRRATGTCSTK